MNNLGKNTLSMLGIAAIAMVATLAFIGPKGADAEDGDTPKTAEVLKKVTPTISMPKLEEDHCVITLKADKESYDIGDKPVLTVEVKNNGEEAVEKSIVVSMTSRDMFSGGRMPAVSRVVWTKTEVVSLAAGESKTLTLETGTEIQDMKVTSFSMSGDGDEVVKDANLEKIRKAIEEVERKNQN
ncbi:MAG: hypothetical protein KDB90_07055 [Planctomycetes bacterium]|nr:hypothetical protein [Planctomycetota bacterium]